MRRVLVAALLAVVVLPGATGAEGVDARQARQAAAPRPNVVVIMTDDQTAESRRVMANVNRLLRDRGAMFVNSFTTYPQCCPSRATFLTGQYAHNHGVLGNSPPAGGYVKLDHSNTLPVWLRNSGYYTAHIGKYLNGYGSRDPTEIPPGWSEWRGSVDPSTYRFTGYTLNEKGVLTTYAGYQTDVYATKAARIIRQRAPLARPFFLSVAFLAPHSGAPADPDDPGAGIATPSPAPRHRNAFAAEPLPRPPSFNEADVSDKPLAIRRRFLLPPDRVAAIRENYRQELESLLAVDEAVARIVTALRETGELGNTLIVFTSDNGFFHGEHRIAQGKNLAYEPAIRVPLILRGPGVPAGLRLSQRVANVDLAPTILDAADAFAGRIMDGRSLLPLVANPAMSISRDLLVERGPGDGQYVALRAANFLYVEHATGERELYDLRNDPYELQSRHADPAYAAVRDDLARRLAHLRSCNGASCRTQP
jgi:N-acetylglucosamine-6-sulfatase